jgi:hypothetical protein
MKSRYQSLLRTSGTSSEVAEFLYPVSGLGPVDDAANIFNLCKNEMHNLIYASLDFIRFKNEDGEFHNVIPEELKIDIKERVENEYQAFIDGLDVERMVNDAESAVLARVEEYAWNKGIKVLPEALDRMVANLSRCAGEYDNMVVSIDDSSLLESYESALKNTLTERIGGTNSNDVLSYRQELIEYLEKECSVRMYRLFVRFFSILASSSVFIDLKSKLEDLTEYLSGLGLDGEAVLAEDTDENSEVLGVVFTNLQEKDPEKTLNDYVALLNDNR